MNASFCNECYRFTDISPDMCCVGICDTPIHGIDESNQMRLENILKKRATNTDAFQQALAKTSFFHNRGYYMSDKEAEQARADYNKWVDEYKKSATHTVKIVAYWHDKIVCPATSEPALYRCKVSFRLGSLKDVDVPISGLFETFEEAKEDACRLALDALGEDR